MSTFTDILYILFIIIQVVLGLYIAIPFLSLMMYGLLNLLKIKSPYSRKPFLTDKKFEFGIIVTAHQETEFILPLVDSILKQIYPNFYVYVVADDCDISKLNFNDNRIIVLKPIPSLHAKVRSIHYAMDNFIKKHDAVIILDSDNLIHPSFLDIINKHFQKGYRAVQADFKPKNIDSTFARMDAIGDMFNFFIDREVRMRLGISSAIWGSGIAFDYSLYDSVEYRDLLGGFDKKLQSHLVLNVNRIAFSPDITLYDEKINSGKSLENQRARWIHSYFKYFKESFVIFWTGIKRFSLNLIYFGFVLLRPPLFIVLGGALLFTVINYFISRELFIMWLVLLASFIMAFIGIVAIKGKDKRFLKTLCFMPLFAFRQVLALLKVKKASKSFLKTTHTKLVYIDDLVK